jgi:hypothetical protein
MEVAGLIISILALIFTGFTYFNHDVKIKRQERLLNEYEIAQIESEKIESIKAHLDANIYEEKQGKNVIKVYNKGKAIARHVNVIIPDSDTYVKIGTNPCPIDLKPYQSIEFTLLLSTEHPDKITIRYEWGDGFNENNFETQDLQLL